MIAKGSLHDGTRAAVSRHPGRGPRVAPGWGSNGAGLIDFHFLVEVRCGRIQRSGVWVDAWAQDGHPHQRAELANQAADKLRAAGACVRVRPVVS